MKRAFQIVGVLAIAGTASGQATYSQIEMFAFEQGFAGTLSAVRVSGDGVKLEGQSQDDVGFSEFVAQLPIEGGDNLSGATDLAFTLTDLSGTVTDAQLFIQTGDTFDFFSSLPVALPDGTPTLVTFDISGIASRDDVRQVGIQFFGDDGSQFHQVAVAPTGTPSPNLGNYITFDQSVLTGIQSGSGGSITSVVPGGSGVDVTGDSVSDTGFSELAWALPLGTPQDISGIDNIAFEITPLSGTADSNRLFVQVGPFFDFFAGESLPLTPGVTRPVFIDVTGLSVFGDAVVLGGQLFGPEGGGEYAFRVEPADFDGEVRCSIADRVEPFGTIDQADVQDFLTALGTPCVDTDFSFSQTDMLAFVDLNPNSSTIDSIAADGSENVLLEVTNNSAGDVGVVTLLPAAVDLTDQDSYSITVEVIDGSYFNGKSFIQTDLGMMTASFTESPLTDIESGIATFTIDLSSVPNTDQVIAFGFQLFGPDDNSFPTADLRVMPASAPKCDEADIAAPIGQFDAFDAAAFLELVSQGCP